MSRLLLPVGFSLALGSVLAIPAAPVVAAPPVKAEEELVERVRRAIDGGVWQYGFLRSRANSIEGGTTEIQKNIIAERVLGLAKG